MSGNVWEWVWDWYGAYPSVAQTNQMGAGSGAHRVIRGGGWDFDADVLRSAFRFNNLPAFRVHVLGFRVVRPL